MDAHKTQMGLRQFRIGDLAQELKVKKFVVRFWEKEFDLKSDRSQGGQRFYTNEDLNTFKIIKDLLYNQGFTIAGAKKQLPLVLSQDRGDNAEQLSESLDIAAASQTVMPCEEVCVQEEETFQAASEVHHDEQEQVQAATIASCNCETMAEQLKAMKEKLTELHERLKG